MAWYVVAEAQAFFGEEDIQVVGTVYAMDSALSALMNQPQSYLFFVLNSDQSGIAGIRIHPTQDSVKITHFWTLEQSADLTFTRETIEKLLIVFHEIV
jgi:hypothetical protein